MKKIIFFLKSIDTDQKILYNYSVLLFLKKGGNKDENFQS